MSMIINPYRFGAGGGGGGGGGSLADIVSSTLIDLDASISDSYGGSGQTWSNLVTATGTDYDFYLGANGSASTDDPTFNGTAGNSAAYWSFDGGDFFRIKNGNTAWLNSLHKTTGGTDWWAMLVFKNSDTTWQYSRGFGNSRSTTLYAGISLHLTNSETVRFFQYGNSSSTDFSTPVFSNLSDWKCFIISYDSSAGEISYWQDSRTATTQAFAFQTTTADPSWDFEIGADGDGFNRVGSEMSFKHFSMGNEYLDNTKANLLIEEMETRHGLTFP